MRSAESIKESTEAFLKHLGVEVNTALPCIEGPDETRPKSASEVAQQLIAVHYMVKVGYGYPIALARERLLELGASEILGSASRDIMEQENLSERDKINLCWQVEGLQALAWALALDLVQLDHTRPCDDDLASRVPAPEQEIDFIRNATLRPIGDIQEQVDLIYRMHWAAANARFTGTDSSLNESIIRERRRALDWIYGVDEDWDEVPLDT